MSVGVEVKGAASLSVKFDEFPKEAHDAIARRFRGLVDRMESRAEEIVPKLTRRLMGEIVGRTFADNPDRVAGYVSVFDESENDPKHNEYAKAATLEYGTSKVRQLEERMNLFGKKIHRKAMSKPVRIIAHRYLRDPLEEIEPEVMTEVEAALAETIAKTETKGDA